MEKLGPLEITKSLLIFPTSKYPGVHDSFIANKVSLVAIHLVDYT